MEILGARADALPLSSRQQKATEFVQHGTPCSIVALWPYETFSTPPSPSNSEWLTRDRLRDSMLKASGWTVAPFVHGKPLAAQHCVASEEYPTTAGPAAGKRRVLSSAQHILQDVGEENGSAWPKHAKIMRGTEKIFRLRSFFHVFQRSKS